MANLAFSKTFKVAAIGAISTLYLGTSAWALPQSVEDEMPSSPPVTETVEDIEADVPAAPELAAPEAVETKMATEDMALEPEVMEPDAPKVVLDTMEDVAAPVPTPAPVDMVETKPAMGQPEALESEMPEPMMETEMATPAVSKTALPAKFECFEQDSGETECICQTEVACEALQEADVCMDGSNWTSDSISGCTQKE